MSYVHSLHSGLLRAIAALVTKVGQAWDELDEEQLEEQLLEEGATAHPAAT